MTTLRRVLLQSAKEAGPPTFERQASTASATSTSAVRPGTPHSAKPTSRRNSQQHSASDEGSSEDETRSTSKGALSKRRRTLRGWEDATLAASREHDLKSPRSESSRSPRVSPRGTTQASPSISRELHREKESDDVDEDEAMAIAAPLSVAGLTSTKFTLEPDAPNQSVPKSKVESAEVVFEETFTSKGDLPAPSSAQVAKDEAGWHLRATTPEQASNRDGGATQEAVPVVARRPSRQPSPPAPRESSKPARLPAPPPGRSENTERRAVRPSMNGAADAGRPGMNGAADAGRPSPPVSGIIEQEWVMCEDCKKWRKLPLNITAASLPEKWFCHMNSWNAALAACSAPVEEGSEETPDAGLSESLQLAKKNYALPPGINLYGGQVQAPLTTAPAGVRQPRPATYRELIGSHYRSNKPFILSFGGMCDARYGGFPSYVSASLKPRAFDDARDSLAFPRLGWMQRNAKSGPRVDVPLKVQMKISSSSAN